MHVDKIWENETADLLLRRRLYLQREIGPKREFSQRAVAAKIGVHAASLNAWENGTNTPNSWTIWKKWCDALRVEFLVAAMPRDKMVSASEIIQRCFEKGT